METRLKKLLDKGRFENVPKMRSRIMAAIRGKHTRSTEVQLRMALIRAGITGWKLHAREIPGNPDFYFRSKRVAVFVDGCYWHGCPLCGHIPKTRSAFWKAKITRNQERDRENRRVLRAIGISTIRIWEHELKRQLNIERVVRKISRATSR